MNAIPFAVIPASSFDFSRLGYIEAAGDAQFPPGRLPGEPGSDNVPVVELEAALAEGLLWIAVEKDGNEERPTDAGNTLGTEKNADADRAVGFAVCEHRADHLHLRQIVIAPPLQRRGIGGLFMERVFSEAVKRGCSAVTLTTFADIPWNAPYYRRHGFRDLQNCEMTPELRKDLEAEKAAGMVRRIAMIRSIEL